jgi:hypothetical protein
MVQFFTYYVEKKLSLQKILNFENYIQNLNETLERLEGTKI